MTPEERRELYGLLCEASLTLNELAQKWPVGHLGVRDLFSWVAPLIARMKVELEKEIDDEA